MTDPYLLWRRAGGKRPDEIPVAIEPDFTVSKHSVDIDPDLCPQTARLMHRQLADAGFEARTRMSVARFRELLYLGGDNAGRVKRPEHIQEIFAVQGVKRAGGKCIAVQAHWMGGAFVGMWAHVPGVMHKDLLTEWVGEAKPLLDVVAPKKGKK